MIFTFYYIYATIMQWWRLGTLRNKINGTLNTQNSLLICTNDVIYDFRKQRSIENLLFHNDNRIGCTVVPKQKVHLAQWLTFPKDYRCFPIHIEQCRQKIDVPNMYILVQALLETYTKHNCSIIQIENFGELVAWKLSDNFEAILRTDIDKLTKLIHCFSQNAIDINHELKLLKIETVDIEGSATRIKYDRKFSSDYTQKYSYNPIEWKKFVSDVKLLYAKIRDSTNPKITIENGSTKLDDPKLVPISEVKPIKKDLKKVDDKHMLEVSSSDYRRHKTKDKTVEKKSSEVKSKEEHVKKEEKRTKDDKVKKTSKTEHKTVVTNETTAKQKESKTGKSKSECKTNEKLSDKHKQKAIDKTSKCEVSKTEQDTKTVVKNDNTEQNAVFQSNGVNNMAKPPNILVYAESVLAKDNVKSVLQSMVNSEKYTIYDLPINPNTSIWNNSTVLIIVCGNVPPNITSHLLHYLLNGGQLLCLCSDFLYSVLSTFTTAEVREHELVRFSYGQWKQVQMMHHIFCYQASPAKKQFSKDSDHSNHSSGNGSSPIAPRTPSMVDIQHNGKEYTIQVQVLGTEETWQTPSLLLATVKGNNGRAIFSQVHLEINPNQYEDDERKFEALKESDKARLEILKDILENRLDVDCTSSAIDVKYEAGYFLGRHDLKMKMLSDCENIKNNKLICDKVTLQFYGKDEKYETASYNFLPILIHSCPTNFSTVKYFEALETEHIGRLVLYCEILTSSQLILSKTLTHGLVIIPRQQTKGIGRSKNLWISPLGGALFSLQLHIPFDSPLGKRISLIQHLIMVAIVSSIYEIPGCDCLNMGIKWPNDLYVDRSIKIGGIVINSVVANNMAVINIGCGINLDNSNPTTCLNDLIKQNNIKMKTNIKPIQFEQYFANVFNKVEYFINSIQNSNDFDEFFHLYTKYWLHSNSTVTVYNNEGSSKVVQIIGIDDYGFLKVRSENGVESVVQPDGNSFDMMKGLIAPKMF